MNGNETMDDMITHFTKIINDLSFLGDSIDNDKKMRKVIWALPQSWEVKSITLKELNDKKEIDFIGLIGNLKTYEIKQQVGEEKSPRKKKSIAFKANPTFFDDDDEFE